MIGENLATAVEPSVLVHAGDPVARGGVTAFLAGQRVRLLTKEQVSDADVVIILADTVTSETLLAMKLVSRATSGRGRIVLVANTISKGQFARAVGHGMAAYLPRSKTGLNRILRVTMDSHRGQVTFPPRFAGVVLDHARAGQPDGSAAGTPRDVFTPREVEVLGLFAIGLTTTEVAAVLRCSARDIEEVIRATLDRLALRNHTHAVAHAIRIGAL